MNKIRTAFADGVKFTVVAFETKFGSTEADISRPVGAGMLKQAEAASFEF